MFAPIWLLLDSQRYGHCHCIPGPVLGFSCLLIVFSILTEYINLRNNSTKSSNVRHRPRFTRLHSHYRVTANISSLIASIIVVSLFALLALSYLATLGVFTQLHLHTKYSSFRDYLIQ